MQYVGKRCLFHISFVHNKKGNDKQVLWEMVVERETAIKGFDSFFVQICAVS